MMGWEDVSLIFSCVLIFRTNTNIQIPENAIGMYVVITLLGILRKKAKISSCGYFVFDIYCNVVTPQNKTFCLIKKCYCSPIRYYIYISVLRSCFSQYSCIEIWATCVVERCVIMENGTILFWIIRHELCVSLKFSNHLFVQCSFRLC